MPDPPRLNIVEVNNFVTRTLTGAVFVVVLIGAIVLNPYLAFGLFGVITVLGINEFYRLVSNAGVNANKIPGIISGLLVYTAFFLNVCGLMDNIVYIIAIPLLAFIFISELYRKKDNPFQNISFTILGVIYIAIPFALLLQIGFSAIGIPNYDFKLIVGFFLLLWSSDTGAYLVGMSIGKHPLFPRISPKKSWEGFIGGIFFTMLVAYFVSKFAVALPLTDWLIIALIICVCGVWGDLIESMLKRSLQIKDSGNILPGHGGILDRFDSVLLSAPIVFLYLHTKLLLF